MLGKEPCWKSAVSHDRKKDFKKPIQSKYIFLLFKTIYYQFYWARNKKNKILWLHLDRKSHYGACWNIGLGFYVKFATYAKKLN